MKNTDEQGIRYRFDNRKCVNVFVGKLMRATSWQNETAENYIIRNLTICTHHLILYLL
jgi:hypothetical protein